MGLCEKEDCYTLQLVHQTLKSSDIRNPWGGRAMNEGETTSDIRNEQFSLTSIMINTVKY